MKPIHSQNLLMVTVVLLLTTTGFTDSPPSNTIPIIADRPNIDETDIDTFCMLSWHFFDAIQAGDMSPGHAYNTFVPPANETGLFVCLNPVPIARWGHWPSTWVARMSDHAFSSDNAYARPEWRGITIIVGQDTVAFGKDTLIKVFSAPEIRDSLETAAEVMDSYFGDEEQVWFYNTFDEAPSRQWDHMVHDSIPGYYEVDDYIPNMYTQAMHLVGSDSLPTFEEVDPEGIFSWLKYTMEHEDTSHPVVTVFAQLHTIIDWAYYSDTLGTFHDQANSVRSFLNMEYQGYGNPYPPISQPNRPELFVFDAYPIRQVGVTWLDDHSNYENQVSGDQDTILLNHYESCMDSTCVPVRLTALEQERDIPILYYPQAIGRCGGDVMWNSGGTALNYNSYQYRIPTPQEFQMNCNISLMRDVRGLLPYCMMTYFSINALGQTGYMAGYLDQNNLPFDAPYEEWVYTNRWRSDYEVIPPDSFPPFADSCRLCSDFDPLWNLPPRPTTSGDRSVQDYMMWKFNAYGRLWNSMRDTFGQIAAVAPEMTQLHWWMDEWEDFSKCLVISSTYNPFYLIEPEIRLFNDGDDNAYAFYVNRNCNYATNPVAVTIYPDRIPSGFNFSSDILDHSRRFLIEMEMNLDYDYHLFRDTLDAGQGRLVQFFTGNLPADIRITKPDIEVSAMGSSGIYFTDEYRFPAERQTYIGATFYNMGTIGRNNVVVSLTDLTDEVVLDRDTISFSGLSGLYNCDDQRVSFSWQPGSDDIGVHILEIAAESFTGEPDPDDNSTCVVFQITPRDYASMVLNDPWDMDDDTPPPWHTNDITSLEGWSSTYTDSVSGMFEGTLSNPSQSNKLYLHVGSGENYDVPTRLYRRFSMIAKAESEMTVTLHWQDVDSLNHSIVLGETIGPDWTEMEPVDLSASFSSWSGKDAIKLWLEFTGTGNMPEYVRIGWIRLTE